MKLIGRFKNGVLEKAQAQHERTSKTGLKFKAGKGAEKQLHEMREKFSKTSQQFEQHIRKYDAAEGLGRGAEMHRLGQLVEKLRTQKQVLEVKLINLVKKVKDQHGRLHEHMSDKAKVFIINKKG